MSSARFLKNLPTLILLLQAISLAHAASYSRAYSTFEMPDTDVLPEPTQAFFCGVIAPIAPKAPTRPLTTATQAPSLVTPSAAPAKTPVLLEKKELHRVPKPECQASRQAVALVSPSDPLAVNISPERLEMHRREDQGGCDSPAKAGPFEEKHIEFPSKPCKPTEPLNIPELVRFIYENSCTLDTPIYIDWAPITERMLKDLSNHDHFMKKTRELKEFLFHAMKKFQIKAFFAVYNMAIKGTREWESKAPSGGVPPAELFMDGYDHISDLFTGLNKLARGWRAAVDTKAPIFKPFMHEYMNEIFSPIVTKSVLGCGPTDIKHSDDVYTLTTTKQHVTLEHIPIDAVDGVLDWSTAYLEIIKLDPPS